MVKYVPNDADAKQKLKLAEQTLYRIEFEKAMAYDDKTTPFERLGDLSNINVDPSYTGLRWDDGPLTCTYCGSY